MGFHFFLILLFSTRLYSKITNNFINGTHELTLRTVFKKHVPLRELLQKKINC